MTLQRPSCTLVVENVTALPCVLSMPIFLRRPFSAQIFDHCTCSMLALFQTLFVVTSYGQNQASNRLFTPRGEPSGRLPVWSMCGLCTSSLGQHGIEWNGME